ncbi:hypothetical protein BDN72DRAFT_854794 [Pluteus cervinus]|uniref:Uncharacterized protein n=1 Tax=Pluteus cervinus TaxID=181527 RepID=A0ACD3B4T1_9AGAR|nr:hypothetical protein BDN72DRAFT_854794 [Pluteus cervinus]
MAFQTLTSSSDTFLSTPIPSATSQSSTLPTLPDSPNPTGSNSNGNGANFFSPTTSPPLILAFLAIGLFSVAMIAMFGWRRIQYGRGWAAHLRDDDELTGFGPSGTRGTRGLGRGGLYGEPWFGEKPKLWDLWAEKRTGLSRTTVVAVGADSKEGITTSSVRDEDIRWDNIMSALFFRLLPG